MVELELVAPLYAVEVAVIVDVPAPTLLQGRHCHRCTEVALEVQVTLRDVLCPEMLRVAIRPDGTSFAPSDLPSGPDLLVKPE